MATKPIPRRKSSSGGETDAETVGSASGDLMELVAHKQGIARCGNGQDEEISKAEFDLIHQLYNRVTLYRDALPACDKDCWCDLEDCRRYLVARSWNLKNAEAQLVDTLKWRANENPAGKEFWQSSKCFKDPYALSMRVVGWDEAGHPIGYTRFSEAHDRWDASANLEHMTLLLEACSKLIRQRRQKGLNQTADSRQCVWVVDFDGFNFRDQNPRTGIMVAALLQHYPEMLNVVVLVDPPMLFQGLWKLVAPLLDERVRRKIMFVKGKNADTLLRERLGREAAEWIANETKDSAEKIYQKGDRKKYWSAPVREGQHDSRGLGSYVCSELYIKTPGDVFEEAQQPASTGKEVQHATNTQEQPRILPSFTKTIYSGNF